VRTKFDIYVLDLCFTIKQVYVCESTKSHLRLIYLEISKAYFFFNNIYKEGKVLLHKKVRNKTKVILYLSKRVNHIHLS